MKLSKGVYLLHYIAILLQCIIIYQNFHLIDIKVYMSILGMGLTPLAKVIISEFKTSKKLKETSEKQ